MFMRRFAEPDIVVDWIFALCHRLDRHDSFVGHPRRGIAAELTEGSLVAGLCRDRELTFEDNLGERWNFQVDRPALDDIDRFTGKQIGRASCRERENMLRSVT